MRRLLTFEQLRARYMRFRTFLVCFYEDAVGFDLPIAGDDEIWDSFYPLLLAHPEVWGCVIGSLQEWCSVRTTTIASMHGLDEVKDEAVVEQAPRRRIQEPIVEYRRIQKADRRAGRKRRRTKRRERRQARRA